MNIDRDDSKPNRCEYILPALAIISLIASCIIVSYKKLFWNDELFSYYLIADPSFAHMMSAFSDKINATPPLYFILGWFWAKLFGSTELSLRLFSSLGICIACATVWIMLRRTYNFWSASIGTLGVFCTSDMILYQNAETRMYGLLLAVCSLALLNFDILNKKSKCSWNLIISNIFIHAAIVQTHIFGILYSAAILFTFILRDKYFNVFRPKIYLSIGLSWLSLILYIPAFLNQADAGKPRTWYAIPELADLLINLIGVSSSSYLLFIFFSLILISGCQFMFDPDPSARHEFKTSRQNLQYSNEFSLLIFAFVFLAVPVFVWIISLTIKPIYWYRYMIPSTLSWSILIAYLASCIISPGVRVRLNIFNWEIFRFLFTKKTSILLLTLATILLVNPILYGKNLSKEELPGSNDDKYGYKELPIVTQISHDFIKRIHYSPNRSRYFFILDWQSAVDNSSGRFTPGEYKNLDALKRNYPEVFQNNIILSQDFLKMYNRFLVLDYLNYNQKCTLEDFFCPRWLEMRILNNSSYKVTSIGDIKVTTIPGDIQDRKLLLIDKIK
ncbi:glycosyltransferase family 39 protein [Microseira wollei]|uniref:Glycosyltransferase RgtA/B/C/D-like domain-containing protein n=1 Tax=Microseira wollei NIES-4236 TaxID=2530354 RepID=A0AAV3WEI6_9CYAN|nr:glycosyltransferase family 39 protein [Microseira wollei]GET35664.1 hypothetical protein MiSe_04060 [Microseira wollei NIES-4236]